jgi:hypothetical protein
MHVLDRRRFLVGAGAVCGFAGASSLAALIAGCSPPDAAALEDRVRTALRELSLDAHGARLIAAAAGIPPAAAFEMFRRDLSSRSLYALSSNGLLLSEFIEARCSADLESGRTRRIHGWWIAETELAVAVLSAG